MNPSYRAPIVIVCLGLASCGGPPAPDVHAAFRRIQEHEAVIAHRAPAAASCADDAPCPARDEVCEAARAICDTADDIDDADARARCALAERRCEGAG